MRSSSASSLTMRGVSETMVTVLIVVFMFLTSFVVQNSSLARSSSPLGSTRSTSVRCAVHSSSPHLELMFAAMPSPVCSNIAVSTDPALGAPRAASGPMVRTKLDPLSRVHCRCCSDCTVASQAGQRSQNRLCRCGAASVSMGVADQCAFRRCRIGIGIDFQPWTGSRAFAKRSIPDI